MRKAIQQEFKGIAADKTVIICATAPVYARHPDAMEDTYGAVFLSPSMHFIDGQWFLGTIDTANAVPCDVPGLSEWIAKYRNY